MGWPAPFPRTGPPPGGASLTSHSFWYSVWVGESFWMGTTCTVDVGRFYSQTQVQSFDARGEQLRWDEQRHTKWFLFRNVGKRNGVIWSVRAWRVQNWWKEDQMIFQQKQTVGRLIAFCSPELSLLSFPNLFGISFWLQPENTTKNIQERELAKLGDRIFRQISTTGQVSADSNVFSLPQQIGS